MTTIAAPSPVTSNKLATWIARNGPVLAIFAVVFAVWEISVRALGVPDYILPSPSVIESVDAMALPPADLISFTTSWAGP